MKKLFLAAILMMTIGVLNGYTYKFTNEVPNKDFDVEIELFGCLLQNSPLKGHVGSKNSKKNKLVLNGPPCNVARLKLFQNGQREILLETSAASGAGFGDSGDFNISIVINDDPRKGGSYIFKGLEGRDYHYAD